MGPGSIRLTFIWSASTVFHDLPLNKEYGSLPIICVMMGYALSAICRYVQSTDRRPLVIRA